MATENNKLKLKMKDIRWFGRVMIRRDDSETMMRVVVEMNVKSKSGEKDRRRGR